MSKRSSVEEYGSYYEPVETVCKVAYEKHQDPNAPCGLFIPGYFKKAEGKGISGRPEESTIASVPDFFRDVQSLIKSNIIEILNKLENWQVGEIPHPIGHRLWKDREWVLSARDALAADDSMIAEQVDPIINGNDQAIETFLKRFELDPQSAMVVAHGYTEKKLHDEGAAAILLNFLKVLQTFYVAARLDEKEHEDAWKEAQKILFNVQKCGTSSQKAATPFNAIIHKATCNSYVRDFYLQSKFFLEAQQLIEEAKAFWPWPVQYFHPQLAAAVLAQLHLNKDNEILNYDAISQPAWFFRQERNPAYYFLAAGVQPSGLEDTKKRLASVRNFGRAFCCAENLIRTTFEYSSDDDSSKIQKLSALSRIIAGFFGVDEFEVAIRIKRDIADAADGRFQDFCAKFLQKTAMWYLPKSPYLSR